MATKKGNRIKIRLISEAGTGYFYVTYKNPKNSSEKLTVRKYDAVKRVHCNFKEAKIK